MIMVVLFMQYTEGETAKKHWSRLPMILIILSIFSIFLNILIDFLLLPSILQHYMTSHLGKSRRNSE